MSRRSWLFGSLLLAGFECSTHITFEGRRLDVIAATHHDVPARGDYALCRAAGMRAVREAARWPVIDRAGAARRRDARARRFKSENFSCQTLFAGEGIISEVSMVVSEVSMVAGNE